MLTLLILKGLPASGKSTYARSLCSEHNGWKRVNKDDLRKMIDDGKWSRENEKSVLLARDELVQKFLDGGYNVVVDDTNLDPSHEKRLRDIASTRANVIVSVKFFDLSIDDCIARDLKRADSVGETVIRKMYTQYLKKPAQSVQYNPELPDAYIFDVDGTLALKGDRDIFDYSKVSLDFVNEPIANIARLLDDAKYSIIICSGRNDDCRDMTVAWFMANNIPFKTFLMRKTGDRRQDSIVKRELYEEHIRGRYNILGVYDDRNQVVDMWREIGLTCFQVAPGDF